MTINKATPVSGACSGGGGCLHSLGPLLLMAIAPAFIIVMWHVSRYAGGDITSFALRCKMEGIFVTLYRIWPSPWEKATWSIIVSFVAFEAFLMGAVPGAEFVVATTTPSSGHRSVYTVNGLSCYLITLASALGLHAAELFDLSRVYDRFGHILSSMNVFVLLFCTLLYAKGRATPSAEDVVGTAVNFITDYYWGTEVRPHIFGQDVKMFANRIGRMYWAVGILCYAAKNAQLNGGGVQPGMFVNVTLQLMYITKSFHWELGYVYSADNQRDRVGFFFCFGYFFWVPAVYTSHSFYLAGNCPDISVAAASAIFMLGATMIWVNYDADNQRYVFRQTCGSCTIWGIEPKKIIAQYRTTAPDDDGGSYVTKESLLLRGGWWSLSRHFQYLPEILASFCWSLPSLNSAGASNFIVPYFYVIFLTILLVNRSVRDDEYCRKKYGKYWDEYCREVPYRIVPYLV